MIEPSPQVAIPIGTPPQVAVVIEEVIVIGRREKIIVGFLFCIFSAGIILVVLRLSGVIPGTL